MTDFYDIKLNLFCHLNPQTAILKNHVVKKIGMECLTPFRREINGFSEELFSAGSKFKNGDTLLARITPCLENGKTAFVNILGGDEVAFGSTEFIILREKQGVSDALFLYYFAISSDFRKRAISLMSGTSGRQRVDAKILGEEVFSLPPLDVQKRIAGILGALDDRIDVLRRENVVLEQMAQAVFQSWFVDFDIVRAKAAGTPESEVCEKYHITPELYALFPSALTPDNLPLGWEKKTLEDMGMIVGGGTPSTENEKFFALAGTAVPWITPKDLSGYADKYISHGSIDISQEGLKHSSAKLMPQGTVLFSSRAPIGYCVIAEKPVSTNQGFKSIIPNKREYIEYLYQFLKSNVSMISRYASGSTFKEVSGSVMKQIPILMPPEKLLFAFENMCFCFNAKNKNNSKQIRALSATRDALLPKLMNGEIEV